MVYGFKDGTLAVIAADLSESVQATTGCCVESVDTAVCASHLRAIDLWRSLRARIECEILALNARHGRRSSTVGSTHPCRVRPSCNWSTTWCCFGPYEHVDAMLRWAGQPATHATSAWRSVNAVRAFTAYTKHLSVALKPAVGRRVAQRFALGARAAALDTARLSAQRCDCDRRRDRGRIDVGGVPAVPARTGPARSHSGDPGCQPYLYRAVHARDVCPVATSPGCYRDSPATCQSAGTARASPAASTAADAAPKDGRATARYASTTGSMTSPTSYSTTALAPSQRRCNR